MLRANNMPSTNIETNNRIYKMLLSQTLPSTITTSLRNIFKDCIHLFYHFLPILLNNCQKADRLTIENKK